MITLALAPAELPAGRRIYAIGDVHGCAERLALMHGLIREDLASRPIAGACVVHLGDLIDRGPDSAGVIRLLLAPWPGATPPTVINLMGNHEDMMLEALSSGDPESRENWLVNGGADTLRSWGLSHHSSVAEWRRGLPPRQIELVRGLALMHECGGYAFVHAGIDPGRPIHQQTRDDLLWIREPFLSWTGRLPKVIVHGHTPARSPEVRPWRIGVDTGAVMGGPLTCAVLENDTIGFLRI